VLLSITEIRYCMGDHSPSLWNAVRGVVSLLPRTRPPRSDRAPENWDGIRAESSLAEAPPRDETVGSRRTETSLLRPRDAPRHTRNPYRAAILVAADLGDDGLCDSPPSPVVHLAERSGCE
jgi:hypothetical protein